MDLVEIKKMYDGFSKKGCTFTEFARRIKGMSDPARMKRDLGEIELRRARERSNRMRINKAMDR